MIKYLQNKKGGFTYMKQTATKFLSALLIVAMLVGMVPMMIVSAAETGEYVLYTFTDCVEQNGVQDQYVITLPSHGRVHLRIDLHETPYLGTTISVHMKDKEGNTLIYTSANNWYNAVSDYQSLQAGEYDVFVTNDSTSISTYDAKNYTLTVYFEKNNGQFEIEPNDTMDIASHMQINKTIEGNIVNGNVDWFVFSIEKPGSIQLCLNVDYIYTGMNVNAYLLNSNGDSIISVNNNYSFSESYSNKMHLNKGTYYIYMADTSTSIANGDIKSYELTALYEENTGDFEIEPNNTKENASPLIINKTIAGNVVNDNADWFVVNLEKPGNVYLCFDVDYIYTGMDVRAVLQDESGNSIISVSNNYSFSASYSETKYLNAGAYYVCVTDNSTSIARGDIKDYKLTVIHKETYDSDRDGLLDFWETSEEYIYYFENGNNEISWEKSEKLKEFPGRKIVAIIPPLAKMGADPNVPDIYVECDWMKGFQPTEKQLKPVYEAFQKQNINLHIDAGLDSIDYVTGDKWETYPGKSGGEEVLYSDEIVLTRVMRGTEKTTEWDWYHDNYMVESRRRVFRHCIFANKYKKSEEDEGGSTGVALGQNFLVTVGKSFLNITLMHSLENRYDYSKIVRNTFMHELGHTLGLDHNRFCYDDHNKAPAHVNTPISEKCSEKDPLYISVMSYSYQIKMDPPDYASGDHAIHDDWGMLKNSIPSSGNIGNLYGVSDTVSEFYTEEMTIQEVIQNILLEEDVDISALIELIEELQKIEKGNYDDDRWNEFRSQLNAAIIVSNNPNATQQEFASAIASLIIAYGNLDVNKNSGDVNGDGVVDPTDVAYLRRWLAHWEGYEDDKLNLTNADINGDGVVDPTDVAILRRYLAQWEGVELQ